MALLGKAVEVTCEWGINLFLFFSFLSWRVYGAQFVEDNGGFTITGCCASGSFVHSLLERHFVGIFFLLDSTFRNVR